MGRKKGHTEKGHKAKRRHKLERVDESRWRAQERYYDELVNPDPTERGFKRNVGRYRAELHERFSSPLYPFVFVLIIAAYLGQAQSTRQNRLQATVGGFFVARIGGFVVAGISRFFLGALIGVRAGVIGGVIVAAGSGDEPQCE